MSETLPSQAKIHFVCTGNICRSPFAVFYLQSKLGHFLEMPYLSSSGIFVLESRPPSRAMSEYIRSLCKAKPEDHLSNQTDYAGLDDFDLILTMTSDQRTILMEESPQSFQKIFTLREFALILETHLNTQSVGNFLEPHKRQTLSGKEYLVSLTRLAAAKRNLTPTAGTDLDVVDPYGKSDDDYRQAVNQMVPALDVLAGTLTSQQKQSEASGSLVLQSRTSSMYDAN